LAVAQASVAKNLGLDTSDAEFAQYAVQMEQARARVKFTDAGAFQGGVASALAAGATKEQALAAASAAARLNRDDPGAVGSVANATIATQRVGGFKTPEEAVGFLLSASQQSNVDNLGFQVKNLAPALTAAKLMLKDPDRGRAATQTAALFGTLSKAIGDDTGDITRTNTTSIIGELNKFATEGFTEGTGKKKKTYTLGNDPGTLRGRIDAIANDPVLKAKFIDNMSIENKASREFVKDLLNKGDAYKTFVGASESITAKPEDYEAFAGRLETATPELRAAAVKATTDVREQQRLGSDDVSRRIAAARGKFANALGAVDPNNSLVGVLNRGARLAGFDMMSLAPSNRADPEGLALSYVKQEEARLRGSLFFNRQKTDDQLTPEEAKAVAVLREIKRELETLRQQEMAAANNRGRAAIAERGNHAEK
jgi:hypothetical protein